MPANLKDQQKNNLFLFHGPEYYLTQQKINLWKNKFIEKYGDDTNITTFDSKQTKSAEIIQAAETMPFLSDKRLIIVKNFLEESSKEEQNSILKKLEEIPEYSIVVFLEKKETDKRSGLYKKLNKIGKVENFLTLEGSKLTDWIINQTKISKASISRQTAEYLAYTAGSQLWTLQNEIQKLALYANGKEISTKDIDQLVSQNLKANIFKLTDQISQKKPDLSLKTLHQLIDSGEDLFMIFHMIIRQFRILIQIKDLIEKQKSAPEIAQITKIHPFVIKNAITQSRNFTLDILKLIYQKLLEMEIDIKTGKIRILTDDNREFTLALDKFVIKSSK